MSKVKDREDMSVSELSIVETWDRFHEETKDHVMQVLLNEGLYRHVRFANPRTGAYWFELITTPNNLLFRGDGESFAFSREIDMFDFFRSGINKDGTLGTNPHYWSEKLTTTREAVRGYSKEIVKEYLDQMLADMCDPAFPAETQPELAAKLRKSWVEADEWGYLETFQDFTNWLSEHEEETGWGEPWEWPHQDFDWWFLWACCGIVWGIDQFLKAGHKLPTLEERSTGAARGYDVASLGRDVAKTGVLIG